MRTLIARLRREDGVALFTVMGALTITALLAVSTVAVSLDGNQTSAKDRDAKRAAAAAQAALDLAYLRLTRVQPTAAQCVTASAVAPNSSGECPEHVEGADAADGLGNGAEMRYVVGREGATGCRELPADTRAVELKARDRCITATGVVNRVTRRAQTRVLYIPPHQPFINNGLVARNAVVIRHDETRVNSTIGANGSVTLSNGADVNGQVSLGPYCGPASTPIACNPEQLAGSWSYSTGASNVAGNPVTAAKRFEFPPFDQAFADAWAMSEPPAVRNASMGGYYNAATRTFTMGNNPPPLTLNGGTYVVCDFTTNQGANVRVRSGQIARIFVDSPRRPGSPCAAGQGTFSLGQLSKLNLEEGANPAQLELYVYGTGTGAQDNLSDPDINMGNATTFYGSIYAPDASLRVDNGAYFRGAATVKNAAVLNNADFIFDASVATKTVPNTGFLDRKSWSECAPVAPVPADMESGCS